MQNQYRTHICGELRDTHVGETVKISGWINCMRDHGGLLFLDMRDRFSLTQCVVSRELAEAIGVLRIESVLTINCLLGSTFFVQKY